jgi:predicted PurR-regulated permease PerM
MVTTPTLGPTGRRRLFLLGAALLVCVVVWLGRDVMLPFVLALVVAYVFTPAVAWVERKNVPRALAIVIVYVAVLGTIGGFIRLAAPRMAQEFAGVRKELPGLGKKVQNEWVPHTQEKLKSWGLGPSDEEAKDKDPTDLAVHEGPPPAFVVHPPNDAGAVEVEVRGGLAVRSDHKGGFAVEPSQEDHPAPFDVNRMVADGARKSLEYAQKNVLEIVKFGQEIVRRVSRAIFVFSLTLMLAAYLMLTRERVLEFFRGMVRPRTRPSFDQLLWRIDRGLSGVVRGQLVICLVNGVLSAIGFALVGLKYWPVMALIATVLSLIPIFGSIVSTIPAVALGLTQGAGTAAFVLVWIIVIHQLEANFLNPKIMGDAAKIHPVLVIFSLLVGEHFFHTVGALLAVPCMSIAQSVFVHVRHALESADPEFEGRVGPISLPPGSGPVSKKAGDSEKNA